MTKILLYCIALIITSCGLSPNNIKATDSFSSSIKDTSKDSGLLYSDTTGFFSNCKILMKGASQGALQGISVAKDSANYLCFAACFNCLKTYEIIFVHKGGVEKRKSMGYNAVWESFQKGCDNNFLEFDCFVFLLPLRDPEKQKDVHAMNIDFPVKVRVLKRIDSDNWKQLKELTVNTFKEYAHLQFETIYDLNKKN